jgi:hypothetical protein
MMRRIRFVVRGGPAAAILAGFGTATFATATLGTAAMRTTALATALLAAVAGCDSGYVKTRSSDSGSSTTVSVEIDRDRMRRDKEAFRLKAEEKLREWDRQLADLQDRAAKATGEAKADLQRNIDEQKPKLEAARRELAEIDATTNEKWEDFKARSSKAWDDISSGFERGLSRFK